MKKIFNILSFVFVLAVVITACEDRPEVYEFPVDDYFYDIPDVLVTEDYVIGVPYSIHRKDSANQIWWDNGKQAHQLYTGTPLGGEYDIKDDLSPDKLKQQLDWAKEAGIDFFIINWGGHGYDSDTLLMRYEALWNQDHAYPRIAIRYDPNYLHDRSWKGANDTLMFNPERMDTLRTHIDSLYTHVMTHEFAYKKKDGKPVLLLCNFCNKHGDIAKRASDSSPKTALQQFIDFLRGENNKNDMWIIGELPSNWSSPENWGWRGPDTQGVIKGDTISVLDAMYITNMDHNNYDRYLGEYSFLDYNYRYWQDRMKPLGKEYIPMIFPAYDNRVREPNSSAFLFPRWRENPAPGEANTYVVSSIQADGGSGAIYNFVNVKKNPYQEFANVAKRNVGDSRIIIVRNWNDFNDGNTLEPTEEYGTDYLYYTKKFFKK
jgi:hypothetical protein